MLYEVTTLPPLLDGADHYISIICYVEDFLATDKGTLGTTAAVIVAEVEEGGEDPTPLDAMTWKM